MSGLVERCSGRNESVGWPQKRWIVTVKDALKNRVECQARKK